MAEVQKFEGTIVIAPGVEDNEAVTKEQLGNAIEVVGTTLDEKINITDIVNDLTTGGPEVPLSAEQGKTLQSTKMAKDTALTVSWGGNTVYPIITESELTVTVAGTTLAVDKMLEIEWSPYNLGSDVALYGCSFVDRVRINSVGAGGNVRLSRLLDLVETEMSSGISHTPIFFSFNVRVATSSTIVINDIKLIRYGAENEAAPDDWYNDLPADTEPWVDTLAITKLRVLGE